jgi:hypothetical protein
MALLIPPPESPRRLAGYPTYAFGYGNTFVMAVDSNIAGDASQLAWVKAQLAGVDRRRYVNVFVFLHHPPISSGPHGQRLEAAATLLRANYLPLLRAHHVRALFSGHEHLFEHWVERYQDEAGVHRLDHVITGGGGAHPYGYAGDPPLDEYLKANHADRVRLERLVKPAEGAGPFHYVVVQVDGDRLALEVVAVDANAEFEPYPATEVPFHTNRLELRDPS